MTAPLFAVTPAFAVTFWAKEQAICVMRGINNISEDEELPLSSYIIAGASTALPAGLFICPSERLKCLMQVQGNNNNRSLKYNGIMDCAMKIYKTGGVRSLYKGFGATLLRDTPGNAAYFFTYEFLKRKIATMERKNEKEKFPSFSIIFAGGCAGVVNWIVAMPADVIKSRFQTAPDYEYRRSSDILRSVVKHEGIKSLYSGISPALIRAFPANAAAFLGVELTFSCMNSFR